MDGAVDSKCAQQLPLLLGVGKWAGMPPTCGALCPEGAQPYASIWCACWPTHAGGLAQQAGGPADSGWSRQQLRPATHSVWSRDGCGVKHTPICGGSSHVDGGHVTWLHQIAAAVSWNEKTVDTPVSPVAGGCVIPCRGGSKVRAPEWGIVAC